MKHKNPGFSMLELLLVVAIIGVIAAFALHGAINFVKGYRLHADASAIASALNVTRFRATSQFRPYCLTINTGERQFIRRRLSQTYGSPFEEERLPLQLGVSFLKECPVKAKPGTIDSGFEEASPSIYFNTRGLPVDTTGAPTNNNVIYLTNDNNLYDAITVSLGGRITVWNYSPVAEEWVAR